MTVYELMNLYNSNKALVNVVVHQRQYSDVSKRTFNAEVFEGKYIDLPRDMRYSTVRKWDIEMRNYKVYFVLYV